MHWWDLDISLFRQLSAIKNTNWHALVWPEHKIFSAIFSYQEWILTCIGGTLPQNLFGDFQLSRILMNMYWWDFTTSFRRFSAIKNTYEHALMGPKHKIFSAICSDQGYLWICIGGTLTQNLFGDFQLSRIFIDMRWWDLNTNSFRRLSAIKNTYWHALVGPEHKIFSAIFSYQENSLTCIGGTLTQNFFGDFQLSRILINLHWWHLNTKSFRRFSAIKNTYWHALVAWTQNCFVDFQLSRILIDMHWWDLNTKSFRWI